MIAMSGELHPTATYSRRSWAWVSLGTGFVTIDRILPSGEVKVEEVPALGKLTIRVVKAEADPGYQISRPLPYQNPDLPPSYERKQKRGGKPWEPKGIEIDSYAVQEFDSEYPGSRQFLLLNLSDPEQKEPYSVHVGGIQKCRCMAGDCKVVTGCKHVHACEALLSLGIFDDLETPADSNERSGQWCEPDIPATVPAQEETPVWSQPVPF